MELTQEFLSKYFEAYNYQTFHYNSFKLQELKNECPDEFKLISCMHRKRMNIRKNVECLCCLAELIGVKVYWGDLTFDNEHDSRMIITKRKDVFKHLNDVFSAFLVVEEFGSLHGRYHIHFVGIFNSEKTFKDFHSWHSFSWAKPVVSASRVSKYLCDYLVKQVPRIRRNKTLISCQKHYQDANTLRNFPSLRANHIQKALDILGYHELFDDEGNRLPF